MHGTPEIVITNFLEKSENTVAYPFPVIRGFIAHPEGPEVTKVTVGVISGEPESEWLVTNRRFRGVVSLILGKNVVTFVARVGDATHSAISTNVIFFYQPAQNCQYFVLPLYVICSDSDGSFQAEDDEDGSVESALRRIETGVGLLQSFTAEKLVDEGFPRKTFRLNVDGRGIPRCSIFRSNLRKKGMYAMADMQIWKYLKKEITRAFPDVRNRCKFLAFLADTRYTPAEGDAVPFLYEDMVKRTKGYVALGGSCLALCGTACLYTWPESVAEVPQRLHDERAINRKKFMDDSAYRGTRWACFSTTLGAACHELGHAFNLGHTSAGLMARGFDNIYKEFTVARPAHLQVDFVRSLQSSRASVGPAQNNSVNSSHPKAASDRSDMDVVSSNPEPTLEVSATDASVKSKDRTLVAKVSGTLQSKFFPLKRKELKSDKSTDSHKFPQESPIPAEDGFSNSSCAISLCDPDHGMESRSVSTISTRPSSTISGSKKGGSWHRRISMGIKSPAESCTEEVAHTVRPTLTPTFSYGPAPQTVVTKHYTRQVTYHPSGDLSGEFPLQRHGSSATLPPQLPSHQEKHKAAWKKLFSRKKKNRLRQNDSEISEELPAQMTDVSENPEVQNSNDERTIVSVIPPAKSLIITSDHVASRAGSESVEMGMDIPFLKKGDATTSVDGVFFDSEDEVCEPKSPDSLEEFSFEFGSLDSRVKAMGVALPQHVICELKQVLPQPQLDPPRSKTSLTVSKSNPEEVPVVARKMERIDAEEMQKEAAKPRPTVRSRNGKAEDAFTAPRKLALSGQKSLEHLEKKNVAVERKNLQEKTALEVKIVKVHEPSRMEIRRKSASVECGLDSDLKPQENGKTRFRSTKKSETKEQTITLARRSGSADNVLQKRKPARKEKTPWAEPTEEKAKQDSGIEQTDETDFENSEISEKKVCQTVVKKRNSEDAGKSKLRFPLRTRPGPRQTEAVDQEKPVIRNRIPLQSTQSSRNKENKSSKNSTATKNGGSEKRRATLATLDPRRSSLRRRSSGRKIQSAKASENSQRPQPHLSTRLDFQKVQALADQRPNPSHNRSRSRDSIGNIAGFINTDAESSKDSEETHDWDGSQDLLDGMISPTPGSSNGESESSGGRKVVNRKQHCSSLINTESGISVMDDHEVPHRLPGPVLPAERVNEESSLSNPTWTKNCATLLNYHKWFNDDNAEDNRAPPQLKGDILVASGGLRLVELRDLCGNILDHWEFQDEILPRSFKIVLPRPTSQSDSLRSTEIVVIALDTYGNLMDKTIQLSSF